MIWVDGRIVPDGSFTVADSDRIFEHGLGLFETFRTWNGAASLLSRHLNRLKRSARRLQIPIDEARLPTAADVAALVAANGLADGLLRLTASGGRLPDLTSTLWMTARPLPPELPRAGYRVVDAPWAVAVDDVLCRHKTLNYWSKRFAYDHALNQGADEAIFTSTDGRFWEGSRSNLFLILDRQLVTPPASGPIVPGILRQLVLDQAESVGLMPRETNVNACLIDAADAIFLTNSVRGLIPVYDWVDRNYRPTDPDFAQVDRLRLDLLDTLMAARLES